MICLNDGVSTVSEITAKLVFVVIGLVFDGNSKVERSGSNDFRADSVFVDSDAIQEKEIGLILLREVKIIIIIKLMPTYNNYNHNC